MKNQLTDRQEEILNYIRQFREETGYPPTLREIGKKFGISSTFGVKRHLDALEKKGYLTIESNASRGISHITGDDQQSSVNRIPLVGRVAAGLPVTAIENIEGIIAVDSTFLKKSDDSFALRVKGDSMINAGIFEGDIVIVQPAKQALNGDIIVALINDEATVKRFENKHNITRLIPENDNYPPIDVTGVEDFSIVGKVVGVLRWFN